MNSRDRLGGGILQDEIEAKLEDIITSHPGLRALREQRRREEIENKLQDSKPLADVIENIIKQSPTLSKLFIQGVRIKNPFGLIETEAKGKFKGRKFPSYFKLTRSYCSDSPKHCPINRKFRVQFETDAENDYFDRDREPGEFSLNVGENRVKDFFVNLWNGLATLNVELPTEVRVSEKLFFRTEVTDNARAEPFRDEFYISVEEAEGKRGGKSGKRRLNPDGDDDTEKRKRPSHLDLPNMIELRKSDGARWSEHFKEDADSLSVKDAGDEGYDFYINMDNVYLQTEMKGSIKIEPRLLEARFKYGMVLMGVSLLEYFEYKHKSNSKEDTATSEKIYQVSKAVSPVLLPMIASLGDLELQEF